MPTPRRRKGSLESPKESKICPRYNVLYVMSMDISIRIVQTRKTTKVRKRMKLT